MILKQLAIADNLVFKIMHRHVFIAINIPCKFRGDIVIHE